MKREYSPLFGTLFGAKKSDQATETGKSNQVVITSYSQPHVLHHRMKEEKLSHGETVTANLSPVRLEMDHGRVVMYFCPMRSIEIVEKIAEGDGGSIPAQAKVEGLNIPEDYKPGFYNLKFVTLTSNGTMQVRATEKTVWEFAGEV
jgi:hypothetical protein